MEAALNSSWRSSTKVFKRQICGGILKKKWVALLMDTCPCGECKSEVELLAGGYMQVLG